MSLATHLRAALVSLYSLAPSALSSDQAHEFLMQFQSRNIRRNLQSIQQSHIDKKGIVEPDDDDADTSIDWGSSWLACLQILLSVDAHPTERLFCAQTLMHRLRRVKLAEAVDWEVETQPGMFTEETVSSYMDWIGHFAPHLRLPNIVSQNEEEIKGQLSLLTLAYITIHHSGNDWPFLVTMGSSMAAIALRLRYTPQSVAQRQVASPIPLVDMILHSLQSAGGESSLAVCAALGAIPDTLLASPGGARGKLSMDPRCVAAAVDELRHAPTGVQPVWRALSSLQVVQVLWTCERWAKYLPLPWEDFCEPTLQLAKHSMKHAMPYLVALFEAASWTPEQILSFSLGLSDTQQQAQSSKKRQSCKSKKRHKQLVDEGSTDTKRTESVAEFFHRGDIACKTAAVIWNDLQPLLATQEGIACLCACTNSCVSHWIRNAPHYVPEELIQSILTAFQEVCAHPDRNIRSQTYETLCNLHVAMMQVDSSPLEDIMVEHLFHSSMRLATSCGYPNNYFRNHMILDSDEELEMERNDVRDVLRTVSGGEDVYSGPPKKISFRVLDGIVRTCVDSILHQHDEQGLMHETAVHALSALAKPLNLLAEAYARGDLTHLDSMETLNIACQGFSCVARKLVDALPRLEVWRTFSISRLLNLGMSSLCPAFQAILSRDHSLSAELNQTLTSVMQAAALSVVHVPELAAESTLDHAQYDIRGAFRSPGGEDHVGILVFMRLASEGDALAQHAIQLGHEHGGTMLVNLCQLHEDLKVAEKERGPGVEHGKGVTNRTRRILLEAICLYTQLCKSSPGLPVGVGDDAEKHLQSLFHSALLSISKASTDNMDPGSMFQMCEVAFDISSFSVSVVWQLFEAQNDPLVKDCLTALIQKGLSGYKYPLLQGDEYHETLIQWGRLRGALMTLIKASANPHLPVKALEVVTDLTCAECEAIAVQCQAGPMSHSSIFNEEVISPETLPTGAFIILLAQTLQQTKEVPTGVLDVIERCSDPVLEALLHECPPLMNSSVVDARATMCEAWFRTVGSLCDQDHKFDGGDGSVSRINSIIAQSFCAAVVLILYPGDPSNRSVEVGMSMGGPQTLALMDFFEKALSLGPHRLHAIAALIQSRLPGEVPSVLDSSILGLSIIGAGLFRAASGGLPPWAIEGMPFIFAALYHSCGKDPNLFGQVMHASMLVRLLNPLSGMKGGTCIAGRFFETMKEPVQKEFLKKATEIAVKDTLEGWKRYKTLIKQASGGKKKASGFCLKPAPTTWECARL